MFSSLPGEKCRAMAVFLSPMLIRGKRLKRSLLKIPFYQHKLAEMTITEFLHARHNPALDELLGKTV